MNKAVIKKILAESVAPRGAPLEGPEISLDRLRQTTRDFYGNKGNSPIPWEKQIVEKRAHLYKTWMHWNLLPNQAELAERPLCGK
ncbi:hypothetical protein L596_012572 [Steinernema carpocapsae]|uniref:Uncharacterized protein n=1 Tax=Steinernema carpocapsae TaxID=34508 RepID=A0A4U5NXT6_STECR|nr:hypothetical protein L596_012572 [Steinernema carpocapsae]